MQHFNNSFKIMLIVSIALSLALLGTLVSRAQGDRAQEITLEAQNAEIVRRAIEAAWNGENSASVSELYAPQFQWHSGIDSTASTYTPNEWLSDPNSQLQAIRESFPDIQITIEKIVVTGDTVAVCYSGRGTFKKVLNVEQLGGSTSVLPTGATEAWDGVFMYRLEDGKIVAEWWYWDTDLAAIVN